MEKGKGHWKTGWRVLSGYLDIIVKPGTHYVE